MFKTESKYDTQNRITYAHLITAAAAIGMQMGIFRVLASEIDREWSAADISEKAGVNYDFLLRIMRILAAYGMLDQVSGTTYKASNITQTLALDSSKKTNKIQAEKTTLSQTVWIQSDPEITKMFFDFMPLQRANQISWMDQPGRFWLEDFKMSQADIESGRAVFVDIGGGAGHQCIALRERAPDIEGKVVSQDLAAMADPAAMNPKMKELDIEVQAHDFRSPQRDDTSGAKVYYLRTRLHDWTDGICGSILKQLRDAMAADSVVVLDEKVVPEIGMDSKTATYDMLMIAFVNAKERTKAEWSDLLARNELRVRDVVCYDDETGDCLVFAVKA